MAIKKITGKVAPKKVADPVKKATTTKIATPAKKSPVAKSAPAKKASAIKSKTKLEEVEINAYSPESNAVEVAGEFNGWNPSLGKMKKNKEGYWSIKLKLAPGQYQYKIVFDGSWEVLAHRPQVEGEHGPNNLLTVGH